MSITRRTLIKSLAATVPALYLNPSILSPYAARRSGPFEGSLESLKQYAIPDWFRNAKFGIWAHWGPQSAIEAGDWYARNMYMQGSRQYQYHVAHYGHPSKFGYKDTIKNWKAEAFDADYLMGLYKKAGARYFMTMGVHHDNFDLWNSKLNPWNSVKMGPKKDIVGMFKKAAQKHDLKFGISDHLWISPKWFSVSKGSDKEGPLAGVGYDGASGAFDSLYGDSKKVYTELPWTEEGISEYWKQHWYERIKDLVDQYEPDLLYSDGQLPFQQYGYNLLAHHYNKKAMGKKTQAVYTSKRSSDSAAGICVLDVERGVVDSIWPQPWQTDTCIGDWHYNKERVGHYKSVKTVIDLLVDIVSRNGNLMLNFPLPASGMLDSDELNVLEGITQWMKVNSEAIYDTRPWKIFGTGPQSVVTKNDKEVNSAQQFNEKNRKQFTYEDIRFTKKDNILYAFFMGWPASGSQVIIKPLSTVSEQKIGSIETIELLGAGKLTFKRDEQGLKIDLPAQKPCDHAYALKISAKGI
ncbi:MAG: alpha-L-fucosidase [Niabella sp.]|nr:alpha-L-fucosidase [Niabella sp.]